MQRIGFVIAIVLLLAQSAFAGDTLPKWRNGPSAATMPNPMRQLGRP